MHIESFYDIQTATYTYVVSDANSKLCAVIDSVLNFDIHAATVTTDSIDEIVEYISSNQLSLEWILETHAHADHLTGSYELKQRLGGRIAISENILKVLNYWAPIFSDGDDIENNGRQFDVLFKDEEQFKIGELDVKVIGTPGHTPACVCYVIKNNVFIGDTLFMPHLGTARVDFPDGSAEQLFNSIQKLFSYPDDTNLYVGHDYPKENIQPSCKTTVKDQKENNVILNAKTTIDEYIASRHNLDKSLRVPNLLLPALQVNLRAGRLPKPNANNIQHLMLPLNVLDP